MSHRSIFLLPSLIVLSVGPLARAAEPSLITGEPINLKIRAAVNGSPIYEEEVTFAGHHALAATESLPERERNQQREQVMQVELNGLIDRELILTELLAQHPESFEPLRRAAAAEVDRPFIPWLEYMRRTAPDRDPEEYATASFKRMGVSLAGMRRCTVRNMVARKYMEECVLPIIEKDLTPENIRAYYEKNRAQYTAFHEETVKAILKRELGTQEMKRIVVELRCKATVQMMPD